jgi:LysM repeat protein
VKNTGINPDNRKVMKTITSFAAISIENIIDNSQLYAIRGGSGDGIPIGEDILIPDEEEPED